jgi:hypothetical protein
MTRDGYRDETASLAAENARLRAELARVRAPRRQLVSAAVLFASDVAAVLILRPWFNGASDAKFWAAFAISGALTLAAIVYALRMLKPHQHRH